MTLRDAKRTLLKLSFDNAFWQKKLGTKATRFLNLVFNISESRFEGYPARRYDCTCYSIVCRTIVPIKVVHSFVRI